MGEENLWWMTCYGPWMQKWDMSHHPPKMSKLDQWGCPLCQTQLRRTCHPPQLNEGHPCPPMLNAYLSCGIGG